MKIQILSDLHMEHKPYTLKLHNNTDVLVLAGDICPPKMIGRLTNMLGGINRKLPVVMICGNHEYYNSEFNEVNKFFKDFAKATPNFHFLNNETFVYRGYQFIGSTLWSNFDMVRSSGLPLDLFKPQIERCINDFALIHMKDAAHPLGIRDFSADDCINNNLAARKFIKDSTQSFDGKSVVITHFCPHPKSIHEKYVGNKINCYFTCDCSELFCEKIPLFIHGHTHESCDYVVGGTRVICNPRGYPNESQDKKYNKQLLVELP